jgi:hypothetical protein
MGKSASERCKNIQFNLPVIIVIRQITLILDANPFDRSGNLSAPCGEKLRQSPSAKPRSVWIIAISAAREPMFCFWSHGGKPGNSLLYKTAEWESGFMKWNTQHNHDLTFLRAFR